MIEILIIPQIRASNGNEVPGLKRLVSSEVYPPQLKNCIKFVSNIASARDTAINIQNARRISAEMSSSQPLLGSSAKAAPDNVDNSTNARNFFIIDP